MARKKPKLTAEEIAAYTLLGEAAGEGPEGMAAVMHVIKNRAESGQYPSNIGAVALQHSSKGYQFTTWSPKHGNSPTKKFSKNSKEFKQAMAIVNAVMSGDIPDPTGQALNYFANQGANKIVEPGWFARAATGGKVQRGNHVFAARNAVLPDAQEFTAKVQAAVNRQVAPTPMSGRPVGLSVPPRSGFSPVDVNNQLPMARPQQNIVTGAKGAANTNRDFAEAPSTTLKTNKVKLVAIDPYTGAVVMKDGQPVTAQPPTQKPVSQQPQPVAARPTMQPPGGGGASGFSGAPTQRTTSTSESVAGRIPTRTVVVRPDGTTRVVQAPREVAIPPGVRPAAVDKLMQQAKAAKPPVPESKPSFTGLMQSMNKQTNTPTLGSKIVVSQPAVKTATQTAKPQIQPSGGVGASPTKRTVAVQKIIKVANPEFDLTDAEKAAVVSANANLDEQRQEQALLRALEKKRQSTPQFIEKKISVEKTQTIQQRHQQQVTQYNTYLAEQQRAAQAVAVAGGGGSSDVYQPPTTTIATGKTVPVGLSYTAQRYGNTYQYTVQADGSIRNDTTGRITATPKGPTNQWAKDAGYF